MVMVDEFRVATLPDKHSVKLRRWQIQAYFTSIEVLIMHDTIHRKPAIS